MLRVFVLFTLVFSGAINGASPQTLTPAITVGRGHDHGQTPRSCARLLEQTNTAKDSNGYVVRKDYELAYKLTDAHNKSCAKLYVGVYGNIVRQSIETGKGWNTSGSSSSYVAAVAFMEQNGITCNMQDGVFSLVFSERGHGGDDYMTIDLDCAAEDAQTRIFIGLNEKGNNKLSVTFAHYYSPTVWHTFETNASGAIIKHTKGMGIGPISYETVILEDTPAPESCELPH